VTGNGKAEWVAHWVDHHEITVDVSGLSDKDAAAKAWQALRELGVTRDQVTAFYRHSAARGTDW
jgi:predicted PP-loop superfamily ATPase